MILFWILVGLAIFFALIGVIFEPQNKRERSELKQRLEKRDSLVKQEAHNCNLNVDEIYCCEKPELLQNLTKVSHYLILDKEDKKIGIALINDIDTSKNTVKTFNFKDIYSSSIKQDGETITQASHGIGRAIAGGILAGGAGAIVGATTSKKRQNQKINKLILELLVNDLNNPTISILFYDGSPVFGGFINLEKAQNNIKHWQDIMSVIIYQNKANQKSNI